MKTRYFKENQLQIFDASYRTAEINAWVAIERLADGDDFVDVAAMHSGIALECHAKSALAFINPMLILGEKAQESTLLVLAGAEALGSRKLDTIDGHRACVRLKSIRPDFRYDGGLVFQVRNQIVHGGVPVIEDCRNAIGEMVRQVDWIDRNCFDKAPYSMWKPDLESSAREMSLRSANYRLASAKQKISRCAMGIERTYGSLTPQQLSDVTQNLSLNPPDDHLGTHWERLDHCPACAYPCWLGRESDGEEGLMDVEISCRVCGLSLVGETLWCWQAAS